MENLNNVPSSGTYGGAINEVNHNFSLVKGAIDGLEGRTIRSKGLFPTLAALNAAYPSPIVGDYAYVGSGLPAEIYDCVTAGKWHDTGQTGGSETINLGDYSTTTQMNAAIDSGLQGQVGYAVCSTAGGTARKDVVVSGFKLLANGGALHIKMTTANTNASATMNISPTSTVIAANTKPLFYNGEQATASNTWEANEILSIYYDGTNYQATNAKGGGGKAEKISYDNSKSLMDATTVQEGMDEISSTFYSYRTSGLTLQTITQQRLLDYNTKNWANTNYMYSSFYLYNVVEGQVFRLKGNGTYATYYALFTGYEGTSKNGTPLYVEGTTVKYLGINSVVDILIPEGAVYLFVSRYYKSSGSATLYNRIPSFVGVREARLDALEQQASDVKETITEIDISKNVYAGINYRMIAGNGGQFTSSSGRTDRHINVPVVGGATYRLVCPVQQICAFVTDALVGSAFGRMPHYCEGTTFMTLAAGTRDITAPTDAKYLILTTRNDGSADDAQRPTYFARVEKTASQASYNTKVIQESVRTSDAIVFDYYGEQLRLKNKFGLMAVGSHSLGSDIQSTACYGDYTISINKGVTKMHMRKMTNYWGATISLPSQGSDSIYHGNQCNFGTQKYDENDYFPVFYVSCNNNSSGRCFELVYRIETTTNPDTGEFSSFTATLLQTIYLPVMTDENSLGNCNLAIDKQRKLMYTYSRNNREGAPNKGIGRITRFSKIPPLFDDNNELITEVYFEDTPTQNPTYYIAESFDAGIGGISNNQGADIWNGRLYMIRGSYEIGYTWLYCIDLLQRNLITLVDIYKAQDEKFKELGDDTWKFEPEGLFIWNEDIYISTRASVFLKLLL